ncbi:Bis(5'-nucleosyl)-tetraphosphatase, symmetrical [Tepidimonas alkaliphilus]|uniref:bis(5'-nucleosyl)-tetraphosphatase (symmetrical) n=1 Tax=Tepidimonas alkaliphilus TaxID=2588942 RepID=A0A554W670_9BURK|nr:symmetrical bis(5'-nucleosyl)-tetraphosphatase [Tepidimonas alkaliphilus]TSE19069.1 Bis(5'-nucleosyl)-tetraphosphatase, symmetrical [Tepidimonas alkaliphilus]
MALYLIGDVQGCDEALQRLLAEVGYSPSRDRFIVLGDLVNRGPHSLAVLRRLMRLDGAAETLLGNHDLHLLAVAAGARPAHRSDTLEAILSAPDRGALLDWLARRPLALRERGWLLVHAGVLPAWDAAQTLALAAEVEAVLRSPARDAWLHRMYGNEPAAWDDRLQGEARLRVIVNALTRLRYCTPDGVMEFDTKDGRDGAPPGHVPWFDAPARRSAGVPIAFGHWSTLGPLQRADLLALDSGCVWGGQLSAARLPDGMEALDARAVEVIRIPCAQAQKPGRA